MHMNDKFGKVFSLSLQIAYMRDFFFLLLVYTLVVVFLFITFPFFYHLHRKKSRLSEMAEKKVLILGSVIFVIPDF